MTGAPDDRPDAPERPTRPVAVDYASTVLVVTSVFRLVAVSLSAGAPAEVGQPLSPQVLLIEVALAVAAFVVGVLVRFGRGWVAAVNLIAVVAFLELLSMTDGLSVIAIAYLVLLSAAFVAIYANKPWFDAMRDWRVAQAEARRA